MNWRPETCSQDQTDPVAPWLENSDKSDLPGIENEGAGDPTLPAHTERQKDAARAQSRDKRGVSWMGLVKCLCPVAL